MCLLSCKNKFYTLIKIWWTHKLQHRLKTTDLLFVGIQIYLISPEGALEPLQFMLPIKHSSHGHMCVQINTPASFSALKQQCWKLEFRIHNYDPQRVVVNWQTHKASNLGLVILLLKKTMISQNASGYFLS